MVESFQALVVDKSDDQFSVEVKTLQLKDLPENGVLIQVKYSGINYKDGLASIPNGKIVSSYPFVPGIDLAGVVIESDDPRFKAGDEVIATSYEIGVSHFGGYSEVARIPVDWIVPLPSGLTLKEAMIYGTAGFTAALSVQRLQENKVTPDKGQILVTGATGGVGSHAISMLSKLGYEVTASTGKEEAHDYLRKLGAKDIISREAVNNGKIRPLDKQLWAGAVDPVGGDTLAAILSKIHYNGAVAVSGLTAGTQVSTTVFPFILRAVRLIGIDSVFCQMEDRLALWARMATDLKPDQLSETIETEITLDDLPNALPRILKGQAKGRTIVRF